MCMCVQNWRPLYWCILRPYACIQMHSPAARSNTEMFYILNRFFMEECSNKQILFVYVCICMYVWEHTHILEKIFVEACSSKQNLAACVCVCVCEYKTDLPGGVFEQIQPDCVLCMYVWECTYICMHTHTHKQIFLEACASKLTLIVYVICMCVGIYIRTHTHT